MFKAFGLVIAGLLIGGLAACGSTNSSSPAKTATSAPASAATQAAAAATPATVTLGTLKFNNGGTTSVAGKSELTISQTSYMFTPTFVSGTPGQKVTVTLSNESSTVHNISLKEQSIDKDVPAKAKMTVDLTIPQTGVLLFFCKYHSGSGMSGELLSGSAQPQAVGAPATPAAGSSDYGY